MLADDASFVVYKVGNRAWSPPWFARVSPVGELRIRELNGDDYALTPAGAFPSITSDSRYIMFLQPVDGKLQAFIQTRGGVRFQASNEPEGLAEAVISGNGRRIIATTAHGRLISIETESGVTTQLIGSTPQLEPAFERDSSRTNVLHDFKVPGSTYSIRGEHLAADSVSLTPPLPFEAEGVRVLVDGHPAALYRITPDEILYQVAWETPAKFFPTSLRMWFWNQATRIGKL